MQSPTIANAPFWMTFASLPRFILSPDTFFKELSVYGDVVSFNMLIQPCLSFHHPMAVQEALVGKMRANYDGAEVGLKVLARLIGPTGVLTSPKGDRHTHARKHAGKALHGPGLQRANNIMWEESVRTVDELESLVPSKTPFDMAERMNMLAIRVIGRAVFGVDLSPDKIKVTRTAVEEGLAMIFPRMRMPLGWPLQWTPRFRYHVNALDAIVEEMIDRREKAGDWRTGEDTLATLLRLHHLDQSIDKQEVMDNIKTLFVAGHETTASALTWLWYMLSEHPDLYDWIRDEAKSYVGPLVASGQIGPKRIVAVINESMRMYPVASLLAREVKTRHTLFGKVIEPGTVAFFSNMARHHDPSIWGHDADRVRPSRFLEDEHGVRSKLAHTPFGISERLCLGLAFALYEMATLIALVSQRNLRFELASDAEVKPESAMTRKLPHLKMIAHRGR